MGKVQPATLFLPTECVSVLWVHWADGELQPWIFLPLTTSIPPKGHKVKGEKEGSMKYSIYYCISEIFFCVHRHITRKYNKKDISVKRNTPKFASILVKFIPE